MKEHLVHIAIFPLRFLAGHTVSLRHTDAGVCTRSTDEILQVLRVVVVVAICLSAAVLSLLRKIHISFFCRAV